MGNCYGEDSDLDDEYYSYYGKDNHRKPQPNPTLPEPNHNNTDCEDENHKEWEVDEGYKPEYEGDEEEELEELEPEDEEDEALGTNGEVLQGKHRELKDGELGLYKHTRHRP